MSHQHAEDEDDGQQFGHAIPFRVGSELSRAVLYSRSNWGLGDSP